MSRVYSKNSIANPPTDTPIVPAIQTIDVFTGTVPTSFKQKTLYRLHNSDVAVSTVALTLQTFAPIGFEVSFTTYATLVGAITISSAATESVTGNMVVATTQTAATKTAAGGVTLAVGCTADSTVITFRKIGPLAWSMDAYSTTGGYITPIV